MAGFSTGESNFFIADASQKKSKTKSGLSISLHFSIAQHSRDLLLLESFVNLFAGGLVVNYKKRPLCEFLVTKMDLIVEHIIPFLDKHHILGSKHLDFLYSKSAGCILKNKEHLNENGIGLEQILQKKKIITTRQPFFIKKEGHK